MEDKRVECQFGSLCYQKNKEHHLKYKHSFQKKGQGTPDGNNSQQKKKLKLDPSVSVNKRHSKSPQSKNEQITNNSNRDKSPVDTEIKEFSSPEEKHSPRIKANQKSPIKESNESQKDASPNMKKDNIKHSPDKKTSVHSPNKKDSLSPKNNTLPKDVLDQMEIEEKNNEQTVLSNKVEDSVVNTSSETLIVKPNINTLTHTIEDSEELKTFMKEKYFVDMPDEFYIFWDLCKSLSPKCPIDALKTIDLKLVGPFDIMNGEYIDGAMTNHYRYFYDPPEFQTIVIPIEKSDVDSELHYGYFRDSPSEGPVFIASNNNKDCTITPIAINIFALVNDKINEKLKTSDPFTQTPLKSLQTKLQSAAQKHKIDVEVPKLTTVTRKRNKLTVCKGLYGVGIVVPYVHKTQLGYRPLQKNDKDLRTLFDEYKKFECAEVKRSLRTELEEVCRWANIALDESDFGTGIEFGLDLFGSGISDFHSMCRMILSNSYDLLNRSEFCKILEIHLKDRRIKDVDLLHTHEFR